MNTGAETGKESENEVRRKAEEQLYSHPRENERLPASDRQALIHELQVHQIELEMQNEELRQSQKALEDSRDRYADLFNFAPVGFFSVDVKGLILEANFTATTLLQANISDLVGNRISKFIHKDDQDFYYFRRRRLFEDGTAQHFELRMLKKDGTPFFARLDASPLLEPEGVLTVCRIAVSDITPLKEAEEEVNKFQDQLHASELAKINEKLRHEIDERKEALEALKKSEERYRLLAFNSSDMISRHSPDGNFLYASPAAKGLLGYEPEELERRALSEFCHPDDLSALQVIQAGTMEKPGGATATYRLRRKNGTYVWVETTSRVVRDEASGVGLEIQASTRDFTLRKKAEERIRQQNLELGVLNQISSDASKSLEVDEILASIRNNLTKLSGIPAGTIYLYDDESKTFQLKQDWCEPEAEAFIFAEPKPEDVPELIENQFIFSRLAPPEHLERHPNHKERWVWGRLRIALVAQGILQGVVSAVVKIAPGQTNARAGIIKLLAHEVSTAIFNARLYQAELQSRQFAETLRGASVALTRYLDLDSVLSKLLELTSQVVPYDRAVVYLYETENQISAHVGRGFEGVDDREAAYALRQDLFSRPELNVAFHTRHSVSIPDTALDAQWRPLAALPDVRSWAGVPLAAGDKIIGFCGLEKCEPGFFNPRYLRWAESLAGQASVAIQNAWLFDQVRAGQERMQMLSRRLVDGQEKERSYVARELHDEAGQALVSLMLEIGALKKDAADSEAVLNHVKWLEENTAAVLENLHNLAMDLRPPTLDHLGLVAALRQYIETVTEQNKINIKFEALGLEKRLPKEVEVSLYRIALEAMTNVVRHAHATQMDVLLEKEKERIVLLVEDNGQGFEPGSKHEEEHLGLAGMRERAEMIGAELTVESELGRGTTVQLVLPNQNVTRFNI